jgi:hypothetical protein
MAEKKGEGKDKKDEAGSATPPTAKPSRRKYVEASEKFLEEALLGKRITTVEPTITMALYGRAGVGKTVFGSTLPEPLILAAEPGALSIREKMKDITVIDVKTYDDVLLALEFCRKDTKHRFKSVVIDSISELQRKYMDYLMDTHQKSAMSLDMYGECTNEMRRLVREFVELNMHVLIICGVRDDKDEEQGAVVHKCGMVGRMADELPHYVDVVGYMAVRAPGPKDEDQTVKRFIVVQPMPKYDGKDRSGKLDRIMRPHFDHFVEKIFGGEEQAPEKPAPEKEAPAEGQAPAKEGAQPQDASGGEGS